MGKKTLNKIDILEKNLERIIGFINTCDTKASIILAIIGIIFTVVGTLIPDLVNEITSVKDSQVTNDIYILIIGIISLGALLISIFYLISVLYGRIKGVGASNIYFGDICSCSVEDYTEKIDELSQNQYLNDLISQVKINSDICQKKYERFNTSLVYLGIGIVLMCLDFILLLVKG